MKPPKILMEASSTATKPNVLDILNEPSSGPVVVPDIWVPTAIRAPTTMMPEMAFVTDIKGVWRAGVTLHTK